MYLDNSEPPCYNFCGLEFNPQRGGEQRMMKGFRVRLLPTEEQESLLWQNAGVARFAWNWGLALQMKWFEDGEKMHEEYDLRS